MKPFQPNVRTSEAPQQAVGTRLGRVFVVVTILLAVVPLLLPTVPPLIDLPSSMGRYRIALDYATSPYFRQWFDFHWTVVGNLGVDLTVALLAPLAGFEPAVKLAVMAIPAMTVGGMALIAREIHGRVPLTSPLAFIFAYNYAFNFGFVNFCFAVGLALLVFGLWLRLGRLNRPGLQAGMLGGAGLSVWLAHACGWGMLGVMIAAAAWAERREAGGSWLEASRATLIAAAPLLLALIPMLAWTSGQSFSAQTIFNYDPSRKFVLLVMALKNEIGWIDVGSCALVFLATTLAIGRHDLRFDRRLTTVGLAMLATFLVMPDFLLGTGFIDLRIAPYALALIALAVRPVRWTIYTRGMAILALCFFTARIAYLTDSYARLSRGYDSQLAALDHLPVGSRVFGLANVDCVPDWNGRRMDHVNRMAIVRRQSYTNDTWLPTTASGLFVHPDLLAGYQDVDSQKLMPAECSLGKGHDLTSALAIMPRDKFDHLWLIDVPQREWPRRKWLLPVWHNDRTILYRITPDIPERAQ